MPGRVALAAALAWAVAAPFGGVADDYHYYAPFGAIIVVSTTVMRSVRTSAQVLFALALGVPLALATQLFSVPVLISIATVVGVGTLLARIRGLGAQGSWVPISALFVLLLGQGHPTSYVVGYLGLTMLGAVVGISVNFMLPPLMLSRTERAQDSLRELLVSQLEDLADSLSPNRMPPSTPTRRRELLERSDGVQDLVADALGGPPVNWRVRQTRERADRLRRRGDTLVGLAVLVSEIGDSIWGAPTPSPSWGDSVNGAAARALRASAHALRPRSDGELEQDLDASVAATGELTRAISAESVALGPDLFAAAALAESLRRTNEMLRAQHRSRMASS